jgi:hypothetical protein
MLIALFAAVILATPATASEKACYEQRCMVTSDDDSTKECESQLKENGLGIVAIAIEQQGVDSSPMAYRQTQRTNVRSADSINISVVRAVGGGISALRYGLSNHRILFGLLARHYYINGLRRLII